MPAAGDFTATLMPDIILAENQIWNDARGSRRYNANTEALEAILQKQTAQVTPIENAAVSNRQVYINWLNTTAIGTEPYVATCDPTGTELNTDREPVALTLSRQATPVKIPDYKLWNNTSTAQEQIAATQLAQKKELDQYITRTALAKAITFAGTNEGNTGTPGWDFGTGSTYVADSEWNALMFANFTLQAELNQFSDPYFLHGMNLYLLRANAEFDTDPQNRNRIDQLDHYWDVQNFAALGVPKLSLMVDSGAVAFASANFYTDAPRVQKGGDMVMYRTASRNLPGVFYDVTVTTECEVINNVKNFTQVFEMQIPKFDLLRNPATFTAGNTGVLAYYMGTRPAAV